MLVRLQLSSSCHCIEVRLGQYLCIHLCGLMVIKMLRHCKDHSVGCNVLLQGFDWMFCWTAEIRQQDIQVTMKVMSTPDRDACRVQSHIDGQTYTQIMCWMTCVVLTTSNY